MCGRFAASASTEDIVEIFGVDEVVDEPSPTFNAAPTDPVPAVVERADRETGVVVRKLVTPRWGLVPSWSKDAAGAARLINARSETVATKPAFARAFAARRCLIPADGYYEWETVEGPAGRPVKQPWFLRPAGGGPLVMAGVYEFWRPRDPGDAPWLTTCCVITATAADALGHIHDRMPMTVAPTDWSAWLDPHEVDPGTAQSLLRVPVPEELQTYRVRPLVNNVRNDGAELVLPLE